MASKRRSGLANDRRAYNYYYPKISVLYPTNEPEPVCPSISLDDIATLVGTIYTLNANTTILACQTLIIPAGYTLNVTSGFTLTNYGRIDNQGNISISGTGTIINYYILYNNVGTIFIYGGTITNNGASLYNSSGATFTIIGVVYNNGGVIYNDGTVSLIDRMYNYNNGTITNNNVFVFGVGCNLYNADGSSTCGTGILDGSSPPIPTGTNCPP